MKQFYACVFVSFCFFLSGCSFQDGLDQVRKGDQEFMQRHEQASFDVRTGLLDLSKQNLVVVPDICALIAPQDRQKVLKVDLSHNHLQEVDVDLDCFRNLRDIDLSYNRISELVDLGDLINLEALNLNGNNLDNLVGFPIFENLEKLQLAYNDLKNTKGIEYLQNLLDIDLTGNSNLISLPGIEALERLQQLKADYEILEDEVARLEGALDGLEFSR